jgi:hypothetical protein
MIPPDLLVVLAPFLLWLALHVLDDEPPVS